MAPAGRRRQLALRWGCFAAYTGLIYATLSLVRQLQTSLGDLVGDRMYWPVYIILAGAAGAAAVRLAARLRAAGPGAWAALAGLAAAYGAGLASLPVLVERVHFVEYGLTAVLAFQALRLHLRGPAVYPAAALVTYLAGLGDETIQWLLPNRVGEWRDILLNGVAGALAAAGLALVWRPALPARVWERRETAFVAALAAAAVAATGAFMLAAHDYGFVVAAPGGAWTRSQLAPAALAAFDPPAYRERAGRDPAAVLFAREAKAHFDMVRWFVQQNRPGDAAGEAALVRGLYRAALEAEGWEWTPAEQAVLAAAAAPPAYESTYRRELITAVRPWQVAVAAGLLAALALAWWSRLRPRRRIQTGGRTVAGPPARESFG